MIEIYLNILLEVGYPVVNKYKYEYSDYPILRFSDRFSDRVTFYCEKSEGLPYPSLGSRATADNPYDSFAEGLPYPGAEAG